MSATQKRAAAPISAVMSPPQDPRRQRRDRIGDRFIERHRRSRSYRAVCDAERREQEF